MWTGQLRRMTTGAVPSTNLKDGQVQPWATAFAVPGRGSVLVFTYWLLPVIVSPNSSTASRTSEPSVDFGAWASHRGAPLGV